MMAKTSFCEQPTDYVSKVLSDKRKAKKPLMEKMRRARINDSLNELKLLILEALNKDASRYSKMEKADVLEMTVHYLRELRRREEKHQDTLNLPEYRADFMYFTADVSQKLTATDGKDQLRANFLSQLASRCQGNSLDLSVGATAVRVVNNESIKFISSPLQPVMIQYPSPPPSPQRVSPACSAPTSPSWLSQAVLNSNDSKIEKPVPKATLWRPW